jgi:hypothetical protein
MESAAGNLCRLTFDAGDTRRFNWTARRSGAIRGADMTKSTSSLDTTIVDAASLHGAHEILAERVGRTKITTDYTKLRSRLDLLRKDAGWRSASLNTILLSIDPNSEGQQRFQNMLGHSGFEPDIIHFRDSFVSVPPGRSPNDMGGKSIVTLAPRIAYIAGLMARYPDPHFLVVSHSFELFGPLTDLSRRVPNGRVGVAYFGSLLDFRWKSTGLLDGKLEMEFFDLDPYGDEILGIDLTGRPSAVPNARTGLSKF